MNIHYFDISTMIDFDDALPGGFAKVILLYFKKYNTFKLWKYKGGNFNPNIPWLIEDYKRTLRECYPDKWIILK